MAYCERLGGECVYAGLFEQFAGESVMDRLAAPNFMEVVLETNFIPRPDTLGEACAQSVEEASETIGQQLPSGLCGIAVAAIGLSSITEKEGK